MFLQKTHEGVSQARNLGMEYATGKYINFLDSDDYISKNTLWDVYDFFEEHHDKTDVVAIPMFNFERNEKADFLNLKFKENKIIDLTEFPNNPLMSVSSTFIKNEVIQTKFSNDLKYSEDILWLYTILLKNPKLGVLNLTSYYYRQRNDLNAISDTIHLKKDFYIARLKSFHLFLINKCMDKYGHVPNFIQYMLAYDLQRILRPEDLFMCDNADEKKEFFYLLRHISGYIGDGAIIYNSNVKRPTRFFFYSLRKNGIQIDFENDDVLAHIGEYTLDQLKNHEVIINKININNNKLYIEGLFDSFFNSKNISIEAIKEFENGSHERYIAQYFDHQSVNDVKFLSETLQFKYPFKLTVPLDVSFSKFKLTLKVNYHEKTKFNESKTTSSNLKLNFEKIISDNTFTQELYKVYFNENELIFSKLFNFSIIMAIYNTEEYLNEAIDSIINQSFDFIENTQLILVNDGSTDSSREICLEYAKKYPYNIIVINKKNGGQASARNLGLNYVHGKYVNFLDSDDYLAKNALEEVYNFFEKNYDKTDVVSIPIKSFGRHENEHMLNYKHEETKVINLLKEPNNPQLSASSAFFKYSSIKDIKFPTLFTGSEDANFTIKILLRLKTLGVISSTAYYYRRRENFSSTLDTMANSNDFYIDRLKYHFMDVINYCILKENKLLKFIQYILIYDLQWLISETDLSFFKTKSESEEFQYYIKKIFSHFDDEVILNNRNITNELIKTYLLYLKRNDIHIEIGNYHTMVKLKQYVIDKLANHKLWLDIFEIRNNVLNISGYLNSHINHENISIDAVKKTNDNLEYFTSKYVKYTSRKDRKFLNDTWLFKHNFDIKVPLTHRESSKIMLKVNYHIDGNNKNFNKENLMSYYLKIGFRGHARLSETSNYLVRDSHIIVFSNDKIFKILPFSLNTMIAYEKKVRENIISKKSFGYKEALNLRLLYIILYPFMRFLKRKKKIYLFIDRLDAADDNATHLFKYACKQKDNIKKYFVLSKDCNDYNTMLKFGTVLANKSFRHKLTYLFADKIISTHPYESGINPFFEYDSQKDQRELYNGLIESEIYFLQHGVSKDNISSWMSKYNHNLSLLATVSDNERESFLVEGYNFDEKIVQTLGFPRFDNLHTTDSKKQILIIPTWRKYLRGNKINFINSEYFNNLNQLLTNKELINLAENNNYKIVFKPHPELDKYINESDEKYIDLFDIDDNIRVSYNESYQELFKNSALLITDYSSVFFDFAYMKKPIIYYQPSNDYHYEEGYFNYETMGFGEVIKDLNELNIHIKKYFDKNCEMESKYKKRVNNFFKYIDKNNCYRVYEWINKH